MSDVPDEFAELAEMIALAQVAAARDRAIRADPAAVAEARCRRRRRRIFSATMAVALTAAVAVYVPLTLLAPLTAATPDLRQAVVPTPPATELALPEVGASAVAVIGSEEFAGTVGVDGVLASSGGNGPRSIASITKLVTALVILDAKPLGIADSGPTITFSRADAALYDKYYVLGATIQPMKAGSNISQRAALEVMLISSATNYAEAVSTWAFGSQTRFLAATRAWLAAQGLASTTVVEPTGLDPRNSSTPTDLLALGKLAMQHPVVAAIVASPGFNLPGLSGSNTNILVGVGGVNGIKTGTLPQSGACLLFSATVPVSPSKSITVVGVILGGDNHYSVDNAVRALLDSIKAGFQSVPLITKGQVLGEYTTDWGETARIVASKDAVVLNWSDTPIRSTARAIPVTSAADGAEVGSTTFVAENKTITVPLVLDGAIEGPDAWWRLTHPAELLRW